MSRWLIHTYPQLLSVEDSQRDTPISISLKECALFLSLYANLNGGMLEDGTSYDDDEFDRAYHETVEMRNNALANGEFLPEFAEVYILSPKELLELEMKGTFKELGNNYRYPLGKRKKRDPRAKRVTKMRRGGAAEEGANGREAAAGISVKSTGRETVGSNKVEDGKLTQRSGAGGGGDAGPSGVAMEKKRFPEDSAHEDFEAGQLSSWSVLGEI